jgi:hypothetical protein
LEGIVLKAKNGNSKSIQQGGLQRIDFPRSLPVGFTLKKSKIVGAISKMLAVRLDRPFTLGGM